jgi:nitrogenase molybdenum-iron protein alpha/beta subunit
MVVSDVRPDINAKLIYIPSEGFSCTWTGSVAELNVPLYVDLMDEPENIDPKKVNIVGLYKDIIDTGPDIPTDRSFTLKYQNNANEFKRIIESIGLKLHRALFGGSYEYFRKAPEAWVNVIDCPCWGYPLAKAMRERFGTPFMHHAKPIGVESTIKWIRELAEFTGVKEEAEKFMNVEYENMKDVWKEAKRLAKGKIALIDGSRGGGASVTRPLAQSRFCMELGMTPYIILIHPLAIKAKEETIKYFLSEGVNPLALVGPYHYQKSPYREESVIKDLGADPQEVVYFHNDAFAYAKAETWDPSNVACVSNAGQPFRRTKCGPRDVGFRGAKGMAIDVINAIKAARRDIKEKNRRPTLYGRLMRGKSFDFELKEGGNIL